MHTRLVGHISYLPLHGEIGHISWTLARGCAGEAGLCGVFKGTGAGIDQESSKCMYLE